MAEVLMPILGADMNQGTLVAWRKKPGDHVKRGEIIAEIDTEKALVEMESFHDGVLERILVEPGRRVPVGTVMAVIREEGQPAAVPATASMPARQRVTPAARKAAAELGVSLVALRGSGPDGAVTLEDVQRAARPGERVIPVDDPAARMRRTIAAAMARSKREIPHYYLSHTIDLGTAQAWLTQENLKLPLESRLLMGALLIKAVARALRQVPELNAVWRQEQVARQQDIHVGVAIALRGGGLVAPAIHHTDALTLPTLMERLRDVSARARAGTLRSGELSDATITVTSLGDGGVESVLGIIEPPQVALVGFGKVVERPWVVDGQVVVRPVVTATLSADHRVSDGHRGALFLAAVERQLQQPEAL